ncbi:MAG: FAD-linked oxidase [Bacteroidota bacterium]
MAHTKSYNNYQWNTLHQNGAYPVDGLLSTQLEPSANLPLAVDRYNDAAAEIQQLLLSALNANQGFRAFGSRWSLSNIAYHPDRMHHNKLMNLQLPLGQEDIHEQSTLEADKLFFFQCGTTIKSISRALARAGKSLKTSGASNGQTIAGCISTGVHGSTFDFGAVQDFVKGINLIIGPKPEDVVYLERQSEPALSDDFAKRIQARVIRDDALFNAALVGLGGFGFIHGVLIEAEDRYLLKRYIKKIPKQVAMELANTMDFTHPEFRIAEEVDETGQNNRPYFYKIYVNPYNEQEEYIVELMYKKDYVSGYPDPIPAVKKSIYRDLIHLFIKIAERAPKSIPGLIQLLRKAVLPVENEVLTGTLAEMFWDAGYQGPAFACSFGIDHRYSEKGMQLMSDLVNEVGPIPGLFALRFVKQSDATLAFTKFPVTCVLEIDGVQWEASKQLLSLKEFSKKMIDTLRLNDIPFTMHWGKNADWVYPRLVERMFGEKVNEWLRQRSILMTEEKQRLFDNPFLERIGLSCPAAEPTIV